jgi:elongation factor G
MALKEAVRKCGTQLLEPVFDVEVTVPSEYLGDVMGDLASRAAKVRGMTQKREAQVVNATVPLRNMFGYATSLRSLTQGRAVFSMQFSSYEVVSKDKAEAIMSR